MRETLNFPAAPQSKARESTSGTDRACRTNDSIDTGTWRTLIMSGYERKDFSDDADFEFSGDTDPYQALPGIGRREAERSGPGTAARRTLEALAESRRLNRELAELDGYDDL